MDKLDQKRIRWACRRGMLELDLFLMPFVEAQYPTLSYDEKSQFVACLEAPDPDLYAWCMGYAEPPESLQAIMSQIIAHRHAT